MASLMENGRALVPLRVIFESLGAVVEYDKKTETILAVKNDITVQLVVGNKVAYINGLAKILDVPAKVTGARTMVPIQFVSEAMNVVIN